MAAIAERVHAVDAREVTAALPHSHDLFRLATEAVLSLRDPGHELAVRSRRIAMDLPGPALARIEP